MSATPAAAALSRPTVLADAIPGDRVRDVGLVAGGALLTALFAQIAINVPGSPVPITGQTLAVGIVGASLGARRGASSLALYALLGLFLPFYSEGSSGWDVIWGASGGYIIGFIVAAGVIGWLAEQGAPDHERHVADAVSGDRVGEDGRSGQRGGCWRGGHRQFLSIVTAGNLTVRAASARRGPLQRSPCR